MSSRIEFGREITSELSAWEGREWLVANGIGGYAAGTIGGLLTRRYHGLLVAALAPPQGRTLMVAKLDEEVICNGRRFPLSMDRWLGVPVAPMGVRYLERFRLEGTTPVWSYDVGGALLEKRVWMGRETNTSYVRYDLVRASRPICLHLKTLVNHRDHHGNSRGNGWKMEVQPVDAGLRVIAFPGATPLYLLARGAEVSARHEWYCNYELAVEARRGLAAVEDHLCAGQFGAELKAGDSLAFIASAEPDPPLDGADSLRQIEDHEESLIAVSGLGDTPVEQLVLAADQFVARRATADNPRGHTILAGYHWFGDWGRDTMISLSGLTLATGRPEIAAEILRTYGGFVDGGMLPNRFPEGSEQPDYNTVDAALWFVEAVRAYHRATKDRELLRELYPVLEEIIDSHVGGTRYGIGVDAEDGLLAAGEAGTQLTWMDARVGDWTVTPRIGKPVEINALWFNALRSMTEFAADLGADGSRFDRMATQTRAGFERFWNAGSDCSFDVLDGPGGNEGRLRPNQLVAVSLCHSPFDPQRQKAIVDVCSEKLLTAHGLRSLSPDDPQYAGHYGGDQHRRDGAYHQGTVWAWLIGPYLSAHWRVYADAALVRQVLHPLLLHLGAGCIGTLGEIFDGDPPHEPRGCFAQAWSVAEVLRVWKECQGATT